MNLSCCKSYCAEVLGMRHKKTSSDDHKAHIIAWGDVLGEKLTLYVTMFLHKITQNVIR